MSCSRKWGLGLAGLVMTVALGTGSMALAHGDDDHGPAAGFGGQPGFGGYGGQQGYGLQPGFGGYGEQPGYGGHHGGGQGQWSVGLGGGPRGGGVQFGYVNPYSGFSIQIGNGGIGLGFGGMGGGCDHHHHHGGWNNGPRGFAGGFGGYPRGGWGW